MRDYVVIDLNTTGQSPTGGCIIEVGAIKVLNGVPTDCISTLVCPTKKITPKVTALTGITNEMAFNAPSLANVLDSLYMFMQDLPIVTHDLELNYQFLVAQGDKVGVDFSLGGTRVGVSTLAASKAMLTCKSYKLEALVDRYIDMSDCVGQPASAAYRAEMTRRIYLGLLGASSNFAQLYSYPKIRSLERAVRKAC